MCRCSVEEDWLLSAGHIGALCSINGCRNKTIRFYCDIIPYRHDNVKVWNASQSVSSLNSDRSESDSRAVVTMNSNLALAKKMKNNFSGTTGIPFWDGLGILRVFIYVCITKQKISLQSWRLEINQSILATIMDLRSTFKPLSSCLLNVTHQIHDSEKESACESISGDTERSPFFTAPSENCLNLRWHCTLFWTIRQLQTVNQNLNPQWWSMIIISKYTISSLYKINIIIKQQREIICTFNYSADFA